MKKSKGFTLVELLAVIAILAILVIIALPNVMGMFNTAKENSFTTEVKEIYKVAEQTWINDSMFESGEKVYSRCKKGCTNSLDLTGRSELEYYIKLNQSGKVTDYYATDGTYQYSYSNPDGLKIENIKKVDSISKIDSKEVLTITSKGGIKNLWKPQEGKFRVIHSSDGSIETFDVQDHFDIYSLTKSSYFYGGYFSDYELAGEMDENGNYPNFVNYDASTRDAWKYENAYEENGKSMTPVSQETYFLKEVPKKYLRNYIQYTYSGSGDNMRIGDIWIVSVIDDLAYEDAGFIVNGVNEKGKACKTLTIRLNNGISVTLKPEVIFRGYGVTSGYLTYLKISQYIKDKETIVLTPYYITKDGILIKSPISRSIYFGNGNYFKDMVFEFVDTE